MTWANEGRLAGVPSLRNARWMGLGGQVEEPGAPAGRHSAAALGWCASSPLSAGPSPE